jgi:sarcosine oxidase
MRYDAIVIGVGGMGSAALYHLARRGVQVLGLEQYSLAHDRGSSHGLSRIIRLAYYEHPSYVPLLRRSYELWRELERETGKQLLHITGSIDASRADEIVFAGSRRSCELHDLKHEVLSSAELSQRFPGYRLPDDIVAVFQPDGGFLVPESCVRAHADAAMAHGAELHEGVRVRAIEVTRDGARVRTDDASFDARSVVVSAGAWAAKLLPELEPLAVPERQVVAWFEPLDESRFRADRFPVFNLLVDSRRYYGFPIHGIPGMKIGLYHHLGETTDPDAQRRECDAEDERPLREGVARCFPAANGRLLDMQPCMFTNSPDEHFIIDQRSEASPIVVAAGFSGHGFKFCSVVGEILADLALDGATNHDIEMFALSRF